MLHYYWRESRERLSENNSENKKGSDESDPFFKFWRSGRGSPTFRGPRFRLQAKPFEPQTVPPAGDAL
jgi:hypothetical protein